MSLWGFQDREVTSGLGLTGDFGYPHRMQVLPQPSQLITLQLPRPLGIVFEEDARKKRAVVAGFVPGGEAVSLLAGAPQLLTHYLSLG